MTMRKSRFITATMLALGLAASANLAPKAVAAAAEGQTSTMARVWFLRSASSLNGNVWAAAPMIYANGARVGNIPAGTEFYRDFPPGTYRFTVQPYGLPTGQADTVSLAPGSQTYVQIQWSASWQYGYPEAGWGFKPNTFVVTTMSPQLAQAYLPTLTYHPE
ncbi:MAG TPA: hypothetical protein VGI28_10840 [Stellaceae bacterium]